MEHNPAETQDSLLVNIEGTEGETFREHLTALGEQINSVVEMTITEHLTREDEKFITAVAGIKQSLEKLRREATEGKTPIAHVSVLEPLHENWAQPGDGPFMAYLDDLGTALSKADSAHQWADAEEAIRKMEQIIEAVAK